jgi:hypothetical protein
MKFPRWTILAIGVVLWCGAFAPARADTTPSVHIIVDKYESYTTRTQAGVEIILRYEVNGDLGPCCKSGDLRWIQLVTSSTETGFTPNPNRPFIDPRQGQNIGSEVGNDTPFYDVTYTDTTFATQRPDGSGAVFYDKPAVNLVRATPDAPYSFDALTLVVCVHDNNTMSILAGLEWGFSFNHQGSVSLKPANSIGDSSAVRDAFNTALALDFPGWSIVERPRACGCKGVRETPEPSTTCLLAMGLLCLPALGRRRPFVGPSSRG